MFKAVLLLLTIAGPIQVDFGPFETKEACQQWDAVKILGGAGPVQVLDARSACIEIEQAPDAKPHPQRRL